MYMQNLSRKAVYVVMQLHYMYNFLIQKYKFQGTL